MERSREPAGAPGLTLNHPRASRAAVPFPHSQRSLEVDFKQIVLFGTWGTVYLFRQRFQVVVTD